jgi:hypothetical protein
MAAWSAAGARHQAVTTVTDHPHEFFTLLLFCNHNSRKNHAHDVTPDADRPRRPRTGRHVITLNGKL